jgi:hypothetical protein
MVRKRAPKVPAIQEPKAQMAVRLELPIEDYRRLERQARKLGLTKSLVCSDGGHENHHG